MMTVKIRPCTYIYFCVLLLIVPLPWLTAWLAAVVFHELCHLVAVRLCGGSVHMLTICVGGADMQCSALSHGKYLLSVLSGPVGGFLLLLFSRWIPRTAICSWVLSVYNLLPLLPLDGGRALKMLLSNDRVYCIIEKNFLIMATVIAVFATLILHVGVLPLIIVTALWIKNRKRPCKEDVCKVQ